MLPSLHVRDAVEFRKSEARRGVLERIGEHWELPNTCFHQRCSSMGSTPVLSTTLLIAWLNQFLFKPGGPCTDTARLGAVGALPKNFQRFAELGSQVIPVTYPGPLQLVNEKRFVVGELPFLSSSAVDADRHLLNLFPEIQHLWQDTKEFFGFWSLPDDIGNASLMDFWYLGGEQYERAG